VLFLCRGLFLFGIPQDVEPQDPGSYSRLRLTKLCKLRHGTPAEVDGVGWRRNETKRNGVEVPFSSSVPLWVSCALAYITSSKCYNLEPLPHFLAIVNALFTRQDPCPPCVRCVPASFRLISCLSWALQYFLLISFLRSYIDCILCFRPPCVCVIINLPWSKAQRGKGRESGAPFSVCLFAAVAPSSSFRFLRYFYANKTRVYANIWVLSVFAIPTHTGHTHTYTYGNEVRAAKLKTDSNDA